MGLVNLARQARGFADGCNSRGWRRRQDLIYWGLTSGCPGRTQQTSAWLRVQISARGNAGPNFFSDTNCRRLVWSDDAINKDRRFSHRRHPLQTRPRLEFQETVRTECDRDCSYYSDEEQTRWEHRRCTQPVSFLGSPWRSYVNNGIRTHDYYNHKAYSRFGSKMAELHLHSISAENRRSVHTQTTQQRPTEVSKLGSSERKLSPLYVVGLLVSSLFFGWNLQKWQQSRRNWAKSDNTIIVVRQFQAQCSPKPRRIASTVAPHLEDVPLNTSTPPPQHRNEPFDINPMGEQLRSADECLRRIETLANYNAEQPGFISCALYGNRDFCDDDLANTAAEEYRIAVKKGEGAPRGRDVEEQQTALKDVTSTLSDEGGRITFVLIEEWADDRAFFLTEFKLRAMGQARHNRKQRERTSQAHDSPFPLKAVSAGELTNASTKVNGNTPMRKSSIPERDECHEPDTKSASVEPTQFDALYGVFMEPYFIYNLNSTRQKSQCRQLMEAAIALWSEPRLDSDRKPQRAP